MNNNSQDNLPFRENALHIPGIPLTRAVLFLCHNEIWRISPFRSIAWSVLTCKLWRTHRHLLLLVQRFPFIPRWQPPARPIATNSPSVPCTIPRSRATCGMLRIATTTPKTVTKAAASASAAVGPPNLASETPAPHSRGDTTLPPFEALPGVPTTSASINNKTRSVVCIRFRCDAPARGCIPPRLQPICWN